MISQHVLDERREQGERTRARIIDAAVAEFAAHGRNGANLRAIASRAGVSQSLLLHHFAGKDALWDMVGERITAEFVATCGSFFTNATPSRTDVEEAVASFVRFWVERPWALRLYVWRQIDGDSAGTQRRTSAVNDPAVQAFARAQAAGHLRDDLPAAVVMSAVSGTVLYALLNGHSFDDALAAEGVDPVDHRWLVRHVLTLVGPMSRPPPDG